MRSACERKRPPNNHPAANRYGVHVAVCKVAHSHKLKRNFVPIEDKAVSASQKKAYLGGNKYKHATGA